MKATLVVGACVVAGVAALSWGAGSGAVVGTAPLDIEGPVGAAESTTSTTEAAGTGSPTTTTMPAAQPDEAPTTTTTTTMVAPEPVRGGQFPLSVSVDPTPVVTASTATISIECDQEAPPDAPGFMSIATVSPEWTEVFHTALPVGQSSHKVIWPVPAGLAPGEYTISARCFYLDNEPPLDVPVENRFVAITVVTGPTGPIDSIPQTR